MSWFGRSTSLRMVAACIVAGTLGCLAASANATGAVALTSARADAGSTLTIGLNRFTLGMDPGFLKGPATLVDNIFDTLVERGPKLQLVPGLAVSWKNTSPRVWDFKLRRGVKFTNGEPFDASAVRFTIDRVLDPRNNAPTYSYISTVQGVKVVNRYEVQVITKQPDPLIPARFSRYPTEIVPPKYAQKVGESGFATKPIGTGPYEVASFSSDNQVVMKANPNYWRGRPRIQTVVWKYIPEDSTMTAALASGAIDIADPLPLESVAQVRAAHAARAVVVGGTGFYMYLGLMSNEPPFDNVKVRQALNYAVDRATLAKVIEDGYAIPTLSLYRKQDFGYAGDPSGYAYDPAKAKQLLASAGYPNGFKTTLDVTSSYPNAVALGETIQQELAQIGVTVQVENVPSATYFQEVPQKKQAPMYLLQWGSSQTLDADSAVYPILACNQPYSTFCNPKMQKLLDDERSTLNQAKRKQDFAQIEKLAIQQAPLVFLFLRDDVYGIRGGVHWTPKADERLPVYDMSIKR